MLCGIWFAITNIWIEQVLQEISKELLEHADHMADTLSFTAPSLFVEFTAYTELDRVIEHSTLAPVDVYTTPSLVIELMPAPLIEYSAPSLAVSFPTYGCLLSFIKSKKFRLWKEHCVEPVEAPLHQD